MPSDAVSNWLSGEGTFSLNKDGSLEVRSRFPYEKLPSDQYFRILELFPRRRKLPFELKFFVPRYPYLLGTLSTHALTETISYDCLSYTWGTSHSRRALWLNDTIITISESLDMALQSLRYENESRFLWVDFICINQEDPDEKEQQVRRMYDIYSKAENVIAYVGEEADDSECVPDILDRFLAAHYSSSTDRDARPTIWTEADLDTLGLPPYEDHTWTILQKFVSRPWFSRAWIIQESLAAKNLDILCGSWMYSAHLIVNSLLLADAHGCSCFGSYAAQEALFDQSVSRGIGQLKLMANIGLTFDTVESSTQYLLIDIIEGARHARSTDSRDKVYALLNLCRDVETLGLRPDYRLDVAEVFNRIAQVAVKDGQGGILLLSAGIPGSTLILPSWVPDWSLENAPFSVVVGPSYTFPDEDPRSQESKVFSIRTGASPDQLVVRARTIDVVAELNPLCDIKRATELSRMARLAIEWIEASPRHEHQEPFEVALRTLTCDHANSMGGDSFSQSFLTDFMSYLQWTQYFQNPNYRPEHAQDFMPVAPESIPYLNIFPKREFGNVYTEYLLYQRDVTSRVLLGLGRFGYQMKLARTQSGYVGMVPAETQPQDMVVCIEGVKAPMVLRPADDATFRLIGTVYFHGFMPGEPLLVKLEQEQKCEDLVLL